MNAAAPHYAHPPVNPPSVRNLTSAPMTLKIGPRRMAQPPERRVRLSLTESEAEKCGLGDRWRTANRKWNAKVSQTTQAQVRLQAGISTLQKIGKAERWSQRKLAAQAGLSWGAYRRCRDGQCNSMTWWPRIQAAINKLNAVKH